jgi:hypothetical protein
MATPAVITIAAKLSLMRVIRIGAFIDQKTPEKL